MMHAWSKQIGSWFILGKGVRRLLLWPSEAMRTSASNGDHAARVWLPAHVPSKKRLRTEPRGGRCLGVLLACCWWFTASVYTSTPMNAIWRSVSGCRRNTVNTHDRRGVPHPDHSVCHGGRKQGAASHPMLRWSFSLALSSRSCK